MGRSRIKALIVSVFAMFLLVFAPGKQAHGQIYTDSIAFKIDSVSIQGQDLVYSIMFWRTNKNWGGSALSSQDTVLGNVDLYFWMKNLVFDRDQNPSILRHHPNLNASNSLLDITCGYHAERFLIALETRSAVSSSMALVSVPYNEPTELCKVSMPLNYTDRNPEFVWDDTATGGQSYTTEPLIKELQGDIFYNPVPALVLKDYFKTGFFCQGDMVKLWASGYSTGTKQKMTWLMSKNADMSDAVLFDSNILGPLVGEGQVHHAGLVNTNQGDLYYQISASNQANDIRVDTLLIPNAPGWLDSMYFQCILSDESMSVLPRKSNEGDIQVFLRDSIFAYFASTTVAHMGDASTTQVGASDRTDTIFKCPTSGSYVSLYFFGPKTGREDYTIGTYMTITYEGMDALTNPINPATVELTSWNEVQGKTAPNGRKLYRGTVQLPADMTDALVWVTGVSTQKGCDNGAPYTLYDTVYITDLKGDNALIEAFLSDTTLSGGETMVLNTDYPYTNYYLRTPSNGTLLNTNPKKYQAPASVCDNAPSCKADTIVYQYQINADGGNSCTMEVSQIVNLADYYYLKLKVFLQGAYSSSGLMRSLQTIMTMQSPYNPDVFVSAFPTITTTSPDKEIVDWIEISLRTGVGTELNHKVDSTSVFLLRDGSVCDIEGKEVIKFKQLDPTSGQDRKYYVVVEHRNHLSIRSNAEYQLQASESAATLLDLTNVANVYQGNVKVLNAALGVYGMYGGAVASRQLINVADQNAIRMNNGLSGYRLWDINFDWLINMNDYNLVKDNNGKSIKLY